MFCLLALNAKILNIFKGQHSTLTLRSLYTSVTETSLREYNFSFFFFVNSGSKHNREAIRSLFINNVYKFYYLKK